MAKITTNKKEEALRKILSHSGEFLIVSHFYPDPDAIVSLLLTYEFIKVMNPKARVTLLNEGPIDDYLYQLINLAYKNNAPRILEQSFLTYLKSNDPDTIILLDNNKIHNFTKESTQLLRYYNRKRWIIIDHHPYNINCKLSPHIYVQDKASSTAEIIGRMFIKNKLPITATIANLIYIGIIADTNRFLYTDNVSSHTYKLLAKIQKYISLSTLQIYKNILHLTMQSARLIGEFFLLLREEHIPTNDLTIITIFLDRQRLEELLNKGYKYQEIEHTFYFFINTYLLLINPSDVGIAGFYSVKEDKWYVSLRSTTLDVQKIAKAFNGGGHRLAAGFSCKDLDQENIKDKVLMFLQQRAR